MTEVVVTPTADTTADAGSVPDRLTRELREPVRTCVGCRERASATALFRVVVAPDVPGGSAARVVPDPRRRLPGRGAWLHRDPQCVEQAQRRRAFARALRLDSTPDISAVAGYSTAVDDTTSIRPDVPASGKMDDARTTGRTRTTNEQESDEPQGHSMKRQK